MTLLIKRSEIEPSPGTVAAGLLNLSVYGRECSLIVASREGGYHSPPHRHPCEQMVYVAEGEIWVFVEEDAFLAQEGDFYRIPSNAVHWGWNRSDRPVKTFQAYAPPLDPFGAPETKSTLETGEEVVSFALNEPIPDVDRYLAAEKRLEASGRLG